MKLYIVRHGETLANREHICQGQSDWPLSEIGIQQAGAIAKRLEKVKIDVCFSSDLSRAYETARTIQSIRPLNIITDKRLRERNLGSLQGKPFPKDKTIIDDIPGVESISQMYSRVTDFLDSIKESFKNNDILVVSHGITIKVLLAVLTNKEFDYNKDILSIKNVSLTVCEINNNQCDILVFNDISHIQ